MRWGSFPLRHLERNPTVPVEHRKGPWHLDVIQEVPRHTHLHSRETPRIPPQLKYSPVFPSSSRDEGQFPCFVKKAILAFPSQVKRRSSQIESGEECQGSRHHSKRPECPNPLQIQLIPLYWLYCHPVYWLITWWHVWQPCGTSRERHSSLSNPQEAWH